MTRLLLVDDHDAFRRTATRAFQRAKFEVLPFASGTEALSVLAREQVDLVVTDVFMPDLDGIELLQKLRDVAPDVPVVVVTGGWQSFTPQLMSTMMRQLGVAESVHKPVTGSALVDVVQRVLSSTTEA